MNMIVEPAVAGRKTIPWSNDEYMEVDGLKVVYTADKETGNILVHMPGRITESVEVLRNKGRSVTMPKLLRTERFC